MSIAWENLTEIQRAQIKHCRPDLSEEYERRKENEVICPELYRRPFYVNGEIQGDNEMCKLNNKACVRQSGWHCYVFNDFLTKKEE